MKDDLWRRIPPLGMLALAALAICTVTGIMLVPAFRAAAPMDSMALLLLKNPAGVFVRSLHYWSAQAFLVFTLAHLADHLLRQSETKMRFGLWARLGLSVPVIIAIMLSGFLMRGDAAAFQAIQVLRAMLLYVPLAGTALSQGLTGSGLDLSTVYLHHACTATLAIWLVTVEHSRRIMPTARAILWTMPGVLLAALFVAPGLEWRAAAVEKGPWYLVGLQEILHWLPQPQIVVWAVLTGLLLLILLPRFSPMLRIRVKWAMVVLTGAYIFASIVGIGFRGDGWRMQSPPSVVKNELDFLSYRVYAPPDERLVGETVPMIGGEREGCLACHKGMTGFSSAHDPRTVGCASCHLGNPFTLNKSLAHAGMTRTPGNLTMVGRTCGSSNCHGSVSERVRGSLMNTMRGVVSVDKVVFGESRDLDARFDVAALKHSPADTHLRTLCASCHLGQDKLEPGPIDESSRGGDCSACHLRYDADAELDLRNQGVAAKPMHHPEISVRVPKEACFGCHSRSGRIATNYEGWHETLLDEASAKTKTGWPTQFRELADGRIFERHPADVHFEKGMTCIDCHVAAEVMSDGTQRAHEGDAIKIACLDCHSADKAAAKQFAQLDSETQIIVSLRKLNEPGRRFVTAHAGSLAYPNVFLDAGDRPLVALEESAKMLKPKPATSACTGAGSMHKRLDCESCHTAWAPQCINCHTSFDKNAQGWDHLAGKFIRGSWQEDASEYLGDAPALGVQLVSLPRGESEERITSFIPGMISNLEIPNGDSKGQSVFRRLFAPASPHTIVAEARDCRSCHMNPNALGYGHGRLIYSVNNGRGFWQFSPAYPARIEDGLPQDAWIGFLREPAVNSTTRKGARPFTLQEQQEILLVGACLECHNEKEPAIAAAFADFKDYRKALRPQCRLPGWTHSESWAKGAQQ